MKTKKISLLKMLSFQYAPILDFIKNNISEKQWSDFLKMPEYKKISILDNINSKFHIVG